MSNRTYSGGKCLAYEQMYYLLVFSGSNQGVIYTVHVKISRTEDSIGLGWGLNPLSSGAVNSTE